MEQPLISVIVPVYKVERTLDRCVQSLINQSYGNLEIILVDDGSPDGCPALCDGWAARDGRIRVLHKPNGGLSDARNRGVELARGEYISFVDSDDYVSPDYAEYLLGLLRETGADIACGQHRITHDSQEKFQAGEERISLFTGEEACAALYREETYMSLVTAWAKLFPTALLREIPFPVGRLHEDEATAYRLYYSSGRVALGSRPIYAYYQNSASIVHNRTERNQRDTLLAFEEQCQFYRERGNAPLARLAVKQLLNGAVDLACRGDRVFAAFLREGGAKRYLRSDLEWKTLLRYYGYMLLGLDLNRLYHRILRR